MQKHPDADAFVLEHLRRPTNATTRLVFADWLEETGTPSNVAWAHYIRLRDEASRYDAKSQRHREVLRQANGWAPDIRARLSISAKRFVEIPEELWCLLPLPRITVRLRGFWPACTARRRLPRHIAEVFHVFPLTFTRSAFFVAVTSNPWPPGTIEDLNNLLEVPVHAVAATRTEINAAFQTELRYSWD